MNTTTLDSPIGKLRLCAADEGLTHILHTNQDENLDLNAYSDNPEHPHLASTVQQLKDYFSGKRKEFDLSLAPEGTDFQKSVWQALLTVPYGKTASYADIANHIGNPKAVRAVGAANGRNPISIVIPCHRIIGKNGTLTGYAGGLDKKSVLLEIEGHTSAQQLEFI